jgi:hypothetical protein
MRYRPLFVAAVIFLSVVCVLVQELSPSPGFSAAAVFDTTTLEGKWTYRSFHNNPTMINGDPQAALSLLFAEAVFIFDAPSGTTLKGRIDWAGGGLDLQGKIAPGSIEAPMTLDIVGLGRPGTATAGWEYDYHGVMAHQWPNGVNQVPVLVGSVIRAKPHNGAPAGYVASFIAIKQP